MIQYAIECVKEHWFTVFSVMVYLVANIVPRPSPETHKLTRGEEIFWGIVDRLCFLTSRGLPGSVKMIFSASRPPAPSSCVGEQPESQAQTLSNMPPPSVVERASVESEEIAGTSSPVDPEESVEEPEVKPSEQDRVVEEAPASEPSESEPLSDPAIGESLPPIDVPADEKVVEQVPQRVRKPRPASGSKKSSGKGKGKR